MIIQSLPMVEVLSTGFEPLYRTSWQDAVKDVYTGRLEVIENHVDLMIGTVRGAVPLPKIVRFRNGVFLGKIKIPPKSRKPNRKNIFERDKGQCRYCDKGLSYDSSTVDHVTPKSRGGRNSWNNLVLSCAPCNYKKGSRTPAEAGMRLMP